MRGVGLRRPSIGVALDAHALEHFLQLLRRVDHHDSHLRLGQRDVVVVALDLHELLPGHREQEALLGYARSIAPALAGFILQNQLFATIEQQVMQAVERIIVDGWGAAAFDGESGQYGLLSSGIALSLASAGAESPLLATAADWAANPTTLIQKIANYNYKPTDRTAPLPAVTSANAALIYADVVRLLNLIAQTNVKTSGKVVLYVPTSI